MATLFYPFSIASRIPSYRAKASIMTILSHRCRLFMPPSTFPLQSRATMPIPAFCVLGHQEASQLILMVPLFGFSHLWFVLFLWPCSVRQCLLCSSLARVISSISSSGFGLIPSNSDLHRAFHMNQVVRWQDSHSIVGRLAGTTVVPAISPSHAAISRSGVGCRAASIVASQTRAVHLQPVTMCSWVSYSPHRTQSGSTSTPRLLILSFTGTALAAKRHAKFLTFGTTPVPQIALQSSFLVLLELPWSALLVFVSRRRW